MSKFIFIIIILASISLILYACFLVGKNSENFIDIEEMEEYNE